MTNRRNLQPVRAVAALMSLLRDPQDTAKVFTIIEALSGATDERLLRRMHETPSAQSMLIGRDDILPTLTNHAALEALGPTTFGRAYLDFLASEGISPNGLVEATAHVAEDELDADSAWLRRRLRDTHDLWHTALGYRGDILGEASILAFTFAQTRNPAIGLIVLGAVHKLPALEHRRLIADGFRRGLVAAWLPGVRWELMLDLPVTEVRRQLRIDDPPDYEPLRE